MDGRQTSVATVLWPRAALRAYENKENKKIVHCDAAAAPCLRPPATSAKYTSTCNNPPKCLRYTTLQVLQNTAPAAAVHCHGVAG